MMKVSRVMSECLFCKIVEGTIPCTKVLDDDNYLAFRDIDPKAPTHILVIPKKHVSGLPELGEDDLAQAGGLLLTAIGIAKDEGLKDRGFRFVINSGDDGGQTVGHLHLHILGGRALSWPPG
jgi:histidine triad (HIT) family protein